jgi:cytochrome c biogenesis protein CcdA
LAGGLVISFTAFGFAVAVLGASLGFDGEGLRTAGALALIAAGLALVVPRIQHWLTRLATPLATWANARQQRLGRFGLAGQAGIGVLLGMVWSPCVGPTLGAASALAAQGKDLGQVAIVMLAFGLGIASVLLGIATASRGLLNRWRGRLMTTGSGGKRVLGSMLVAVGLFIVTSLDRQVEGLVLSASPDWLINVTTAF